MLNSIKHTLEINRQAPNIYFYLSTSTVHMLQQEFKIHYVLLMASRLYLMTWHWCHVTDSALRTGIMISSLAVPVSLSELREQGSTETRNPHILLQILNSFRPNMSHANRPYTQILPLLQYTLNLFFRSYN